MKPLEALKHTEWALGVIFFWYIFFDGIVTVSVIFWTIIGSQAPDFVSLAMKKIKIPAKVVRKLTHDYTIPLVFWLIFPINHPLYLFGISVAIHYFIDLFSGLEPLYIFGLIFGEYTSIQYVTATHRVKIGKKIEKWGRTYLSTDVDETTPELAWFWVMQLLGSMFCCLGILFYFSLKL